MNQSINVFTYTSEISHNIRIRNTDHRHTECFQIFRTDLIDSLILWLIMLGAVQLDHELRFGAIEIRDIFSKNCLPTKLCRMIAKVIIPQMPLLLRHFPTEVSCIFN